LPLNVDAIPSDELGALPSHVSDVDATLFTPELEQPEHPDTLNDPVRK
jgi:hypothetical protein